MTKKIQYVVKHPETATVIEKREIDTTFWPVYNRDEHHCDTWQEAHYVLLQAALSRIEMAKEALDDARVHYNDVLNMERPHDGK